MNAMCEFPISTYCSKSSLTIVVNVVANVVQNMEIKKKHTHKHNIGDAFFFLNFTSVLYTALSAIVIILWHSHDFSIEFIQLIV